MTGYLLVFLTVAYIPIYGRTDGNYTGLSFNITHYRGISEKTLNYAEPPDLGTAVNFVFFTPAGAVSNTGTSYITGNIGTNLGAISGLETSSVIGSLHTANAVTTQCSIDVLSAYNQLNAIAPTVTHAAVLGNGETLFPGVYNIAAAGSVAGVLTLDAQGDANAKFIFKIGAALTTGAGTIVNLVNGAAACNVYWNVEGAITMGASTTMRGTLIGNNGAVSMAAGGILEGRLFSTEGAVAIDGVSASIPVCPCTPPAPIVTSPLAYCQNSTAVPLTATGTDLLWGRGSTIATTPSTSVTGTTNYAVTQTVSGCLSVPATITVNITPGPSAVIAYLNSPYRSTAGTAAVTLTGTAGGSYTSTVGLSLNAVTGLVNLAASALGAYTVTYTIAPDAGCDQYQTTAGITVVPPPSVNLGTVVNFALFTASGEVGNTGISYITGDIGTNLGAINNFGIAVVEGSFYNANAITAQCSTDVLSAYNQINAISPTSAHAAVLGNGETLFPGVYNLAAAGSVEGALILDAQGNPDALFIFKIGGAFTTGAGATVNLVNGAAACNVYWNVEGAVAMAASTTMRGTFIGHNGAVSMAAGSTLEGRLLSTSGAVAIDAVSVSIPECILSSVWTGAINTDWYTAGNWFNGIIPTIITNTTIPSGVTNYPLLSTDTVSVQNITIQSNASLTVTGGRLQIAGIISNSGIFNVSTGTISMNGLSQQTLPAGVFEGNQIRHLTIDNSAGVNLDGTLYLDGILLVTSGEFNTDGYLTLISTALRTALIDGDGAGEVLGNVTIQRYLSAGFGYKYFSSPFQAATVGGFSNEVDLNASFPNFYRYDENQVISGWVADTTAADLLIPMQGYAANMGTSPTEIIVDLTGVVNNHTISSPTLYNHHQPYTSGFNLIGNPYPSPIDWDAGSGWSRTNIDNAVYNFSAGSINQYTGTYSSYVNGISSDNVAGPVIAAMQGFFIHVTDGTFPVEASLTINNNARVNNLAPDFFRLPVTLPLLRLTAGFADESTVSDPMVVYFDDAATRLYKKERDALKLMNTDLQVPNLYSLSSDTTRLSIYAWPGLKKNTDIIPLGLKINKAGWITFDAISLEQFPYGKNIYLYDIKSDIRQNLHNNPQYRLYLEAGDYEGRFFLGFLGKDTIPLLPTGRIFNVYSIGSNLYGSIKDVSDKKYDVSISNLLGQVIMQKKLNGNGTHQLGSQLCNGVYIVRFYTHEPVFTQKIFISN